jgi:hypothetical protein
MTHSLRRRRVTAVAGITLLLAIFGYRIGARAPAVAARGAAGETRIELSLSLSGAGARIATAIVHVAR